MKFTFVAVSVPALKEVLRFQERYTREYPEQDVEISCFYVAGIRPFQTEKLAAMTKAVEEADVAVIDTMGAPEFLQERMGEALEKCRGHRIVIGNTLREYLRLGSFSMGSMSKMMKKDAPAKTEEHPQEKPEKPGKSAIDKMHRMRRMSLMLGNILPFGITKDMKNVFLLVDYWQQATQEDITSFFHLLLRQYAGQKFLPKEKPCTMRYGIYLKDPFTLACEESLEKYWKAAGHDSQKDTVALLFYGHSYPNDFLPVVQAVAGKLKETHNILPIAFSQNEDADLEKLKAYVSDSRFPVAAVLNLMPFRLGAGPMGGDADRAVEILKELDAPYLKPFCLTKVSKEEWDAADGVNPGEFLISILLPELDGGILSMPVGVMADGKQENDLSRLSDAELPEIEPMQERIETLCRRLDKLIELQKKKNADKKLAVVFYNYPPGESNVFGGAFLDTFASAAELLKQLKQAGYRTEELTAAQLREIFLTGGRCNQPEWSEEPEETTGEPETFGKADIRTVFYTKNGTRYPIKGIRAGNVFLGLQPARDGQETSENYHDRKRAPEEAYQAFYEWIAKEFRADAILHFGTHGTLEFLPGKENGMTGKCWPDRLIGDIPHFYYYYIGNPSEAMIAKRRSLATLISYQAPPLKKGGLYGTYQELKETIAEYRESIQSAPERAGDLLRQIGKLAESCEGILNDTAGETKPEMTEAMLDAIEERLYTYENSLITDGLHTINPEEMQGLLHALDGRYLSVGTAGDVVKNPDILPSGRNLVQFDPRLVPTRTAYERGAKAAQEAAERYRREKGTYPDTTAVILWGLETSRSQGETIGQIMYDLGLRLKTDRASYDDRLEIIPLEELGRPRMDVVIHICGFFRDMYPNLIDNLNEMLQQLLQRDEPEESNYFARNTRRLAEHILEQKRRESGRKENTPAEIQEAWELASCRIFGPKEGEYGTRLTELVRKGQWNDAAELGGSFVEDLSYGYSYHHRGVAARELLEEQYPHVDFISQVRNNVEYELTDLDHYYEFYGGLARAVENQKGEKPVMYVADTTGEDVQVQGIREALQKGVVTRLLNPAWIDGMMKHDYHGVRQIEKRFENIMGFAASTDAVDSSTFSKLTQCYVSDPVRRAQMQQSNKWAYMKLTERLMEAYNRGYYQATEEELAQIREAYLEAEGEAEE